MCLLATLTCSDACPQLPRRAVGQAIRKQLEAIKAVEEAMERAAAARILAQREIEMERVSESESEYVPRRRRMARMDGGEMRISY